MILRSIQIGVWRCFIDEFTVGPFSDGLNIVHAPNATGKSTLFEAMRCVLIDNHAAGGQQVEALRPWGRALAPRAAVEFEHQGQSYRIAKQFLDGAKAELERLEEGRFRKLAEGSQATDMVREMLTRNPPKRGLSAAEHWGLSQVLWAPQGALALDAISGDTSSAIQAMLGVQTTGAEGGPIEKRIEERYEQIFTGTGKLRSGQNAPEIVRLQQELESARSSLTEARQRHEAFVEASRRVEDTLALATQTALVRDQTAKEIERVRDDAEKVRSLRTEADRLAQKLDAAQARHGSVKQSLEELDRLTAEFEDASTEATQLEEVLALKQRDCQEFERELTLCRKALEDARAAQEQADALRRQAEDARRLEAIRRAVEALRERLANIDEADSLLSEREKEREACIAPTDNELKKIRNAASQLTEAQVHLDAALVSLEIEPYEKGTFTVLSGETEGDSEFKPGETRRIKGTPEVVVDLPGIARLRARGPGGSAEECQATLEKTRKKLQTLTAPFGTTNIPALEERTAHARQLDGLIREAQTRLDTLLEGRERSGIAAECFRLENEASALATAHSDWDQSPPNAAALQAEAQRRQEELGQSLPTAQDSYERASNALNRAQNEHSSNQARLEETRKQIERLQERQTKMIRDASREDRRKQLDQHALESDAAQASLNQIREQLDRFQDDPAETLRTLEARFQELNQTAAKTREDGIRAQQTLDALSGEGTYSTLVETEEQVAQLEAQIEKENLRCEAIRALRDTLANCRSELFASVTEPVETTATRLLQRLGGPRLGHVQIGPDFTPEGVRPTSLDDSQTVNTSYLSGGETEQLYLATRLALAEVLAREERQLVILDDILTATDNARLTRALHILKEAAQRLQILVLTCHPERYAGLADARRFDLSEIVSH